MLLTKQYMFDSMESMKKSNSTKKMCEKKKGEEKRSIESKSDFFSHKREVFLFGLSIQIEDERRKKMPSIYTRNLRTLTASTKRE